jgi:Phosphopantetheine attachment site.
MNSLELIKKMAYEIIGSGKEITAETSFADLEIDQMDVVDILVSLERELNYTFYDKDLMNLNNIQDILDLIEKI